MPLWGRHLKTGSRHLKIETQLPTAWTTEDLWFGAFPLFLSLDYLDILSLFCFVLSSFCT
jgi:hypothetical protein